MAENADGPTGRVVRIAEVPYESAQALARAFGAPVAMPSWWPTDFVMSTTEFLHAPERDQFRISVFSDGRLLSVIGTCQDWGDLTAASSRPWAALPNHTGLWPGQFCHAGSGLRAWVKTESINIQLLGYGSKEDLFRAVDSLKIVSAD